MLLLPRDTMWAVTHDALNAFMPRSVNRSRFPRVASSSMNRSADTKGVLSFYLAHHSLCAQESVVYAIS
jgi:hypothetical protein